MGKPYSPSWTLNEQWAVGLKNNKWTLYRRSGSRWRPVSYFASPEQLLQSLYRKITRTQPADDSLIAHVEHCFDVAQAAADLLAEHISTLVCLKCGNALAAASTTLEGEVKHAP